jgi:hypothetical protein
MTSRTKYDLKNPPKFKKNLTTAFLYPLAGLNYEASEHPSFHLFLYQQENHHDLVLRIDDEEIYKD